MLVRIHTCATCQAVGGTWRTRSPRSATVVLSSKRTTQRPRAALQQQPTPRMTRANDRKSPRADCASHLNDSILPTLPLCSVAVWRPVTMTCCPTRKAGGFGSTGGGGTAGGEAPFCRSSSSHACFSFPRMSCAPSISAASFCTASTMQGSSGSRSGGSVCALLRRKKRRIAASAGAVRALTQPAHLGARQIVSLCRSPPTCRSARGGAPHRAPCKHGPRGHGLSFLRFHHWYWHCGEFEQPFG